MVAARSTGTGGNVIDRPATAPDISKRYAKLVKPGPRSQSRRLLFLVSSSLPPLNPRPAAPLSLLSPPCRRETRKRKPPSYRVLLHNDDYNKREYVVQVLLKVAGVTVEDALNVMQEAHHNGLALVTVCAQDKAEEMCEGMRNSGLIATIEPAGPDGN